VSLPGGRSCINTVVPESNLGEYESGIVVPLSFMNEAAFVRVQQLIPETESP
jgi:hypothetical protein